LAPLLLGRSFSAVVLGAAIGFAVLILVLVAAVVALGAAFARRAERRRACLQTLQTLVRAAPWTAGR
jgi:Na+-transporting methylmalonyl-CoA/oxaloacetate decarboxylase gamma subunit